MIMMMHIVFAWWKISIKVFAWSIIYNGVCLIHNLSKLKSQPQPAVYLVENGKL